MDGIAAAAAALALAARAALLALLVAAATTKQGPIVSLHPFIMHAACTRGACPFHLFSVMIPSMRRACTARTPALGRQ